MNSNNNFSNFVKNVEIIKNGETLKFTIQPIPKDRYDEAVDHMCKFFIADEPLCKCENVKDDPEAIEDMRSIFKFVLDDNLSVAAFFENPEGGKSIMAGLNILYLGGKNQRVDFSKFTNLKTEKIEKIMKIMGSLGADVDVEKSFGCDKYLGGFGLSVDRDYRGHAIGYHLLMARNEVCERNNIFATITIFTSPISIKLAARAGFETLSYKTRKEIVDEKGQLLLPSCDSDIFKCMGKKIR
ncbi:uncharacterized protein LOC122509691 [Leptopilina heterotoma]|uniref:uncharacterized protein LOC122509691 n=1 Tax=Leptopilina heterotoma TaxID=63436 RepID=UPI001CA92B14|nr:uncharacterized protein LOC122509691 [Leptopilina heterotoma]